MSIDHALGPPAMGTGAAGNLALARDAASYCCKFTAIYDLLDNFTSPQVEATEVSINMGSTKSVRRGDKAKVPVAGVPSKYALEPDFPKRACWWRSAGLSASAFVYWFRLLPTEI